MITRLFHGDCLEIMKEIEPGSVDLILCDPPYGTTRCEWDKPIDLIGMWECYHRICKPNTAIIMFSAQPFTTDLINSNRKEFRYEIIWQKTLPLGFLNANRMPLKAHENIVVFYRRLPTYNPIKQASNRQGIGRTRTKKADRAVHYGNFASQDYKDDGTRYPQDIITFSNWNGALFGNTNKAAKHPTQKPVPLLEFLIKTYTNEEETVLDNCMGSGSTGVAAMNTGRKFIGIEKDDHYFEVARERIKEAEAAFDKPQEGGSP